MEFDIITIFPDFFSFFMSEGILNRAQKEKLIKINVLNIRDFTEDVRQVIDDRPFGGGKGMVFKVKPIFKAVQSLKKQKSEKTKVVLFTPRGKRFNQKIAKEFSKLDKLIMICGRYEGIDERVAKYISDYQVSIGDYVMMGGEVAAMAVIETVSRLIPGVIGDSKLLNSRTTKNNGFLEYPQYTRPEIFKPEPGKKWQTPKVLMSGNHKEIQEWREKHSKIIGK